MKQALLLLGALLAPCLAAQSTIVVPASATGQLGGSQGGFPFSYTDYVRCQQAIDTSNFPGGAVLFGMSLRTLTPRSLQSVPDPATQGIRVTLSDSRNPPGALSSTYASNVGPNATVVFDGIVTIQKTSLYDPLEWNLTIPFTTPYVHTNTAPLLIDLFPTSYQGATCNGGGNGTAFDATTDPSFGSLVGKGPCGTGPTVGSPVTGGFVLKLYLDAGVMPYGKACRSSNGLLPSMASSGGGATVGNGSFMLATSGANPSINAGAFLLGGSNLSWGGTQLPLELSAYGMPECFLHQDLAVLLTMPFVGGAAVIAFGIPNNPSLAGQSVFAQWALVDLGANTTGAVLSQGGQVLIR